MTVKAILAAAPACDSDPWLCPNQRSKALRLTCRSRNGHSAWQIEYQENALWRGRFLVKRPGAQVKHPPMYAQLDLQQDAKSDPVWKLQTHHWCAAERGVGMVGLGSMPPAGQALPTFHGKVYVVKKARKSSDLPASMTNASAAQRRIIEPDAGQPKVERDSRCAREQLCSVNAEVKKHFQTFWNV